MAKQEVERFVLVVRHGTKQELANRYDLPIVIPKYCKDINTFDKLQTIKNSPNATVFFASPFLRTKQTAGRMASIIDHKQSILLDDGLGEAYEQVSKQLKKCNDPFDYRAAHTTPKRLDKCMQNIKSTTELDTLEKAMNEIGEYKFRRRKNSRPEKSPTSTKEHGEMFKQTLFKIMKDYPKKDIVIITHGRNVRKSMDMLAPRMIPRVALVPPTCASVLYKEDKNGIRIANSKGIVKL